MHVYFMQEMVDLPFNMFLLYTGSLYRIPNEALSPPKIGIHILEVHILIRAFMIMMDSWCNFKQIPTFYSCIGNT